jgi:hypothetical protein
LRTVGVQENRLTIEAGTPPFVPLDFHPLCFVFDYIEVVISCSSISLTTGAVGGHGQIRNEWVIYDVGGSRSVVSTGNFCLFNLLR